MNYINWSYDSLMEMLAKCKRDMAVAQENGKSDLVLGVIKDLEAELDYRWNRVSDR